MANDNHGSGGNTVGRLYESSEESIDAYTAVVSAGHVETFARMELAIRVGRREGARFWDAYTAESFWDLHRGGSLYALGHRHPHVVAAPAGSQNVCLRRRAEGTAA